MSGTFFRPPDDRTKQLRSNKMCSRLMRIQPPQYRPELITDTVCVAFCFSAETMMFNLLARTVDRGAFHSLDEHQDGESAKRNIAQSIHNNTPTRNGGHWTNSPSKDRQQAAEPLADAGRNNIICKKLFGTKRHRRWPGTKDL